MKPWHRPGSSAAYRHRRDNLTTSASHRVGDETLRVIIIASMEYGIDSRRIKKQKIKSGMTMEAKWRSVAWPGLEAMLASAGSAKFISRSGVKR